MNEDASTPENRDSDRGTDGQNAAENRGAFESGVGLETDQDDADGDTDGIISSSPVLTVAGVAEHSQSPALPFPVVAFGASAGGLQAFKEILENLDPNTGMAFVLVTHLSPDQKTFLSEIVERYTKMPVSPIQEGTRTKNFADPIVENLPLPIVVLNQDCTIRTHNIAFRQLSGLKETEISGRSLPVLLELLWGIDRSDKRIFELLAQPTGFTIEFEHESTTQKPMTLLIKGSSLSAEGDNAALLTLEDITLRRKAEAVISMHTEALQSEMDLTTDNLARTQGELRGLNAYLFTVQEAERQRIARELHDDISQRLSLLEFLLNDVRLEEGDGNRLKLENARQQLGSINTDVRQLSHQLHPAILNDLGLSAALKALVAEFGERENMPATYVTQNLPESWSQETATAIYRIAQEALRNVSKHAGKTHVKVILAGLDECLQLKVIDFGIGFDQEMETATRGLGMISMQERARMAGGRLTVTSKLGEGTRVLVSVPLKHHA